MIKNIAIIPARGGSKGVPKKNIKKLGNFSLIAYSIIACKLTNNIEKVVVSTDDKEIARIAIHYGASVPFIRPKNISNDKSTDLEFMNHAIKWFKNKKGYSAKNWIVIRPTTPLRDPNILDKSITYFNKNPQATSLVSVHPISETPAKMFGMNDGYLHGLSPFDPRPEYYILPRQEFPLTYSGNGYVDIVKTSTIEEMSSFYGPRMLGFETNDVGEVDTEEDFNRLEFNLDKFKNKITDYLIKNYDKEK